MTKNSFDNRDLLALWSVQGIGSITARKLISYTGSIQTLFKMPKSKLQNIPGVGTYLANKISESDSYKKADSELKFVEKYNIQLTSIFDSEYPSRLKQCEDAPLILFTKGQAINNNSRFVSIVGTRKATSYGVDFCNNLISNLKERGHNPVIVSGLAFGIDIAAHKASLKNELATYGVLAHGLDNLYPSSHKNTASKMLENGGLITEFMQGVFADKNNFVRRNRIIAGLSDAVIVVESDKKGGSLHTAEIANSYNRDVFALPGKISDKYSTGCNNLIKSNRAALIQNIEDLEYIMGWEPNKKPVQKELFKELEGDEKLIFNLFNKKNKISIDEIYRSSGFSMAKISSILLNLEFNGFIKCNPGKIYCKV